MIGLSGTTLNVAAAPIQPQATPTEDDRPLADRHARVVEYLKKLPPDLKATAVDFARELNINLAEDVQLLETLKSNKRFVIITVGANAELQLQYRAKFMIRDKSDLLRAINSESSGIFFNDIKHCYPLVEADCSSLVLGGEIIAARNIDEKCPVLYPRGQPFLTPLSGSVTARPGQQLLSTSQDLSEEIRRGESVLVQDYWYRVSSTIAGAQLERSKAPLSVTLDKPMSEKNAYIHMFTAQYLPLDGEFNGSDEFQGVAYRHGTSRDLQALWKQMGKEISTNMSDARDRNALRKRLIREGLVTRDLAAAPVVRVLTSREKAAQRRERRRVLRKPKETARDSFGTNAHLKGSKQEKAILEAKEKAYASANARK